MGHVIAISGKGGVGKTMIATTLARLYADEGKTVYAADADPDTNLGLILVHRILSNRYIDLSDFSYAALSSVAVATATPPSSALHMRKSSCANIADT